MCGAERSYIERTRITVLLVYVACAAIVYYIATVVVSEHLWLFCKV